MFSGDTLGMDATQTPAFADFQGEWARCPLCEGACSLQQEACCGGWGPWGCCGEKVFEPVLCHWCEGEGRLPLPLARELALSSGNPAFFARIEAEAMAAELIEATPGLERFARGESDPQPSAPDRTTRRL